MNSTTPSPYRYALLLCGLLCLSALHSCNAPHDNPLDPDSPYYAPPSEPPSFFSHLGARVRSLHTARNFPIDDSYSVLVEAWAPPEVVMDSVYVRFDGKAPVVLRRASQDTAIIQVWKTSLTPNYLSSGSDDPEMRSVAGKPFLVSFKVQGDSVYRVDTTYVFRVIYDTPELVRPTNRDTVGVSPTLEWERFEEPFDFCYLISIWRDEAEFEVKVWDSDTLDAESTQLAVETILPTGNYYWTLFAIDAFGNYSRSTEGEFYARSGSLP